MQKLCFGVFENFKGFTTLLLWGGSGGFAELHRMFRALGEGRLLTARLEEMAWAETVDGTSVQLSIVPPGDESMKVSPIEHGNEIDWRSAVQQFAEAADLVEVLVPSSCKTGHQYLPTSDSHPVQIIVSKGEYGLDGIALKAKNR